MIFKVVVITFGRIDAEARAVEGLLVEPVAVAVDGAGAEDDEDDVGEAADDAAVAAPLQEPAAEGHQEAEPYARREEHPLGHDEAHVEEEVRRREERKCRQRQAHQHRLVVTQQAPSIYRQRQRPSQEFPAASAQRERGKSVKTTKTRKNYEFILYKT